MTISPDIEPIIEPGPSRRYEAESLLLALVLSRPGSKSCALVRACEATGFSGGLPAVAEKLGFSYAESIGIMRGWDRQEHGSVYFNDIVRAYAAKGESDFIKYGERLGKRLYQLTHRVK